jgi:hypothetical protein
MDVEDLISSIPFPGVSYGKAPGLEIDQILLNYLIVACLVLK